MYSSSPFHSPLLNSGSRVDKLSQGKRKREGENLVGGVGKHRMIRDAEGFAHTGPSDVIDLSPDSEQCNRLTLLCASSLKLISETLGHEV
jgi:hypothetical protein